MKTTTVHNQRMAKLSFATVYPLYLSKVLRKGKTEEELQIVIHWLTGFTAQDIQILIEEKATFETFFKKATVNPKCVHISGMICGYRIEEIDNDLTRQVRYLDKLVDELANGKKMDKILRTG